MAKLTEGIGGRGHELAIGEMREFGGHTLTRTDRPYAYDLADAYNQGRPADGKAWFVDHAGNLRFGDTPDGERHTAKQIVQRRETERARWMRNYLENQRRQQRRDEAA